MTSRRFRSLYAAPMLLAALGGTATAGAQDPFVQAERWTAAPAAGGAEWTPEDVHFAGDGAFVWAAVQGSSDTLHLYDSVATGASTPRGIVPRAASEYGSAAAAAGTRGDRVFALRQFKAGSIYSRVPIVQGFDPTAAHSGGFLSASWQHDMGVRINGPVRLAADARGDLVAAAVWNSSTAEVVVHLLDGSTGSQGSPLRSFEAPAFGLSALAVSADGHRVALVAGMVLYVLDADANLVHTQPLSSSTSALDISADGGVICYGEIGGLRAISDMFGFGYGLSAYVPAIGSELPSRVAVSPDGTLFAIAWWNYATGREVRLQIFDTIFGFGLAETTLSGGPHTPQNLPSDVEISADGFRAVFATWGNSFNAEVVVLEAASFAPLLEVDLPGSARAVALDASGSRIAIAHKDVHSSILGSTGAVRLVDTGERTLQVTETPTIGGSLELVARQPGSTGGFFLVGPPAVTPFTYPNATGSLLLDRPRLQSFARPVDSNGRMTLSMPIGNAAALVGVQLHLQAAFRTHSGLVFSDNVESPILLR